MEWVGRDWYWVVMIMTMKTRDVGHRDMAFGNVYLVREEPSLVRSECTIARTNTNNAMSTVHWRLILDGIFVHVHAHFPPFSSSE